MKEKIDQFWQFFLTKRAELENLKNANEPVYDEVLKSLQRVNPGLFLEFCSSPGIKEIIITADGNILLGVNSSDLSTLLDTRV